MVDIAVHNGENYNKIFIHNVNRIKKIQCIYD